jgi:catechol 2,3-dioxygenase-like lactoylglutathione lyase family enzyme
MFTHIMIGADDIAASKAFYDATLGTLGVPAGVTDEWGRVIYAHGGSRFLLTKPIDGAPASHGNGTTIGFAAASTETADEWHATGLANGGTACEAPPGIREATGGRKLYLAYLRDPSGNKICVLHRVS